MTRTSITIEECFEFVRNGMNVRQSKDQNGLPITRIETISSGEVDLRRVGYAGLDGESVEKWILEPGDILFSHINSVEHVGKCALYEGSPTPLVHGMNLLCLRPKQNLLIPQYAKWMLKSNSFRSKILPFINKAVNQASLSTKNLKSIEVTLPSLDEQKRIAAILDKADALRRLRQRTIDLLNTLGQAVFISHFGEDDFPKRSLKHLGKVSTGFTPSTKVPKYFGDVVPFITPGDLADTSNPKRYLTELGASKSRVVEAGALFVCCIGSVGKMGVATKRSAFNQQINAISWGEEVVPTYGYYAMLQEIPTIEHWASRAATTLPILKKSEFEKLEIPVADIEKQVQFDLRVRKLNSQASSFLCSRKKAEELFKSLECRAFQGEL